MRLLTYTKYLWRKIRFYDKIAQQINPYMHNPFDDKPKSVTVVWFEDDDKR